MSQDNLVTLYCKETKEHVITLKNKKKLANAPKLTLKKFSKKMLREVTDIIMENISTLANQKYNF